MNINEDGKDTKEIKSRTTQGRIAIKRLNGIWWNKKIPKNTKKRIYDTIVKSIVICGIEVWRLNESDRKKDRSSEDECTEKIRKKVKTGQDVRKLKI